MAAHPSIHPQAEAKDDTVIPAPVLAIVLRSLAPHLLANLASPKKHTVAALRGPMTDSCKLLEEEQQALVPRDTDELYASIGHRVDVEGSKIVGRVGPGAKDKQEPPEQAWVMETGRTPGAAGPAFYHIEAWGLRHGMVAGEIGAVAEAIHARGWPPSDGSSPHVGKEPPIYVQRSWLNKKGEVMKHFRGAPRQVAVSVVSRHPGEV